MRNKVAKTSIIMILITYLCGTVPFSTLTFGSSITNRALAINHNIDDSKINFELYFDEERMNEFVDDLEFALRRDEYLLSEYAYDEMIILANGLKLADSYKEMHYLKEKPFVRKLDLIYDRFVNNKQFRFLSEKHAKMIKGFITVYTSCELTPERINDLNKLIVNYRENPKVFRESPYVNYVYYYMLESVFDYLEENVIDKKINPKTSPYFQTIDMFIAELFWALDKNVYSDRADNNVCCLILKNWEMLTSFYSAEEMDHYGFTQAYNNSGLELSSHYFAAYMLLEDYNGKDIYDKKINKKEVIKAYKKNLLPQSYSFDNGRYVILAGPNVTKGEVQQAYGSLKEVEAGFFKIFGLNDKLRKKCLGRFITLYAGYGCYPLEYDFLPDLMEAEGVNSDFSNGIVSYLGFSDEYKSIENGKFRSSAGYYMARDLIYPYVHKDNSIYSNNRIDWYKTGVRKLLIGSNRTDKVALNQINLSYLMNTKDSWYDVEKILTLRNGNYVHDYYAMYLFEFLYAEKPEVLNKVTQLIRENNCKEYDRYIKELSKDKALNKQFHEYLSKLKKDYINRDTGDYIEDYSLRHPAMRMDTVVKEIQKALPLKNISVEVLKSSFSNTFELKGEIETNGKQQDVNDQVNEMLKTLSEKEWSGYKTFTAYAVKKGTKYEVVIHGVCTDSIKVGKVK